MRRIVLALVVFAAMGDSCAPSPGVVGVQDYGQVTGRVLDAMTNRPINAALVSVGSLYAAASDAGGAFLLRRVPAGDQTVTARAPGYSTGTGDVTVLKDRTVSAGFVRLVPLIRPAGQPTLPPPSTPTPAPAATPAAPPGSPAAGSASPAPVASPSPVPTAVPSPATTASLPAG